LVFVSVLAGVVATSAGALAFTQGDPCTDTKPLFVCPGGTVDASYSITFKANGGCGPALPYQYRVLNGALPPGLSLSTSGTISGKPTRAGTYNFWVELSDEDPPSLSWCDPDKAEREFSITVLAGISIDNQQTTKYWTLNQAYSDQLTATLLTETPAPAGAPKATATWTQVSGALPPGVTLAPNGLVSGTPTAEGVYTFKVRASLDASRWDEETLVIDVKSAVQIAAPPVPKSEVGAPFSLALAATGGTGPGTYTWTLEGTLPEGVVFDPTTATFSGRPRATGAFAFSAKATDQQGRTATYPGRIVVAARLDIATQSLRPGKVGKLYRAKLKTLGGVKPTVWKVKKGPLPRGIRLDRKLGVLSGTPRKAGRYRVVLEVTDELGVKSTQSLVIVVTAPKT
jgi:hypothetical protein